MTGGVILNNSAGEFAGAVYLGDDANFKLYDGLISKNHAEQYGGVMWLNPGTDFYMYGGIIENNAAGEAGGAVVNVEGNITMVDGIIRNNSAGEYADDIYTQGGSCSLIDANGFGVLAETGKQIDGWYEDGIGYNELRWNKTVDAEGNGITTDYNRVLMPNDDGYFDLNEDGKPDFHKDDLFISKYNVTQKINDNVSLKAAHDGTCSVTYNLKGGSWTSGEPGYISYEDGTYVETVVRKEKAKRPSDPEKTGFAFAGWYTDDDCTDENAYDFENTSVTGDVTLFAKWSKAYTVTYTDGVEDETVFEDWTVTVIDGEPTPAFEGTPERYGYVFKGWDPKVSEKVTEDVIYTALWEKMSAPAKPGPPIRDSVTIEIGDAEGEENPSTGAPAIFTVCAAAVLSAAAAALARKRK